MSSKLKSAHEEYVPYKLVVGQKEVDDGFSELKDLVEKLAKDVSGKPFIPREWPAEVSRQL